MKNKILTSLVLISTLTFIHSANAYPYKIKPMQPFRIADNLYYVGNSFEASYLIVTPQGNILLNSNDEKSLPLLKDSIKKLGFNYKDIKVLLIGHAHSDHAGAIADIKKETSAKLMVMNGDVASIETGGKADFRYGDSKDPENFYQAAKVDRVLHDGDHVQLGNVDLTAHLTAGHTKGCTTWTMNVNDKGKHYRVVFVGGLSVNPGYKLIDNAKYPDIAKDYEHSFAALKSLPCDIFLGSHGMTFNMEQKLAKMKTAKINVFVDPVGYQRAVKNAELDYAMQFEQANQDRQVPEKIVV